MAVITQIPSKYTPSDNPIVYVFKQDILSAGNQKFKVSFVVDLLIGGASVGTFEVFPELITSYYFGKIDLSDKIRAYINNHAVDTTGIGGNLFVYDTLNYAEVSIQVYDKFTTNINNEPTVDVASVNDSGITFAFKGCLDRNEYRDWDYVLYKKGTAFRQFLTTQSFNTTAFFNAYSSNQKKSDTTILSWFDNTDLDTPANYKIRITYTKSVGSVTFEETFLASNQGAIAAVRFNMDEQLHLGNITQSTYDDTINVTIVLVSGAGTIISSIYQINYTNVCFDNGANLLWLNKFGSYDNYRFTYNSRISAKIESKSFSKPNGEWNAVTNSYNVSNNTFGKIDYLKTITKQLELSSDWLIEDEQAYVCNLYESPLVYLNDSTSVENVVVTNSAYQIKQSEHDDLFNEIVNIEFTNKKSISL